MSGVKSFLKIDEFCLFLVIMPLEARDGAFFLDGKKVRLLSGTIHYFRVLPEYWEDRLQRLKASGLNCVETLVLHQAMFC